MTEDLISPRLEAARLLRPPRRDPQLPTKAFIDALLEYTLDTAFHQAELEDERLITHRDLAEKERDWHGLSGWESLQRGKTDSAREEAKRALDPPLAGVIDALRWRVARLTEQIERLEREATKVSRAYTMLGG